MDGKRARSGGRDIGLTVRGREGPRLIGCKRANRADRPFISRECGKARDGLARHALIKRPRKRDHTDRAAEFRDCGGRCESADDGRDIQERIQSFADGRKSVVAIHDGARIRSRGVERSFDLEPASRERPDIDGSNAGFPVINRETRGVVDEYAAITITRSN